MTIIVYRDGLLAADTSTWQGSIMVDDNAQKIVRVPSGHLVACAGQLTGITLFRDWAAGGFKDNKRPPEQPEDQFGALVIDTDGIPYSFNHTMQRYPVKPTEWAVEGSHVEFLTALMIAGKSAVEAVEIGIKHLAWAGGRVFTMRVGETD